MNLVNLVKTCEACPSQWEAWTEDGRMIYIRYRWGGLSVDISNSATKDISDVFNDGHEILFEQIGDGFDGVISWSEIEEKVLDAIEKHNWEFIRGPVENDISDFFEKIK